MKDKDVTNEISVAEEKCLIEHARKAREFSYSPYSKFRVGAALLSASGKIFTGCNIENVSYSPTNCAERTAVFHAVSQGEREFKAIAIIGDSKEFISPCGVCRQVMVEFCNLESFVILMADCDGNYKKITLKDLLPMAFQPDTLNTIN